MKVSPSAAGFEFLEWGEWSTYVLGENRSSLPVGTFQTVREEPDTITSHSSRLTQQVLPCCARYDHCAFAELKEEALCVTGDAAELAVGYAIVPSEGQKGRGGDG